MKKIINTLCITIILLSFNKISFAQIEEHYHSFSANLSAPIVIDDLKVRIRNQEETWREHIPDKQISIAHHISVKDMRVEGNTFSGMKIEKSGWGEVINTFSGEVSEDKQMIKHIVLTKNLINYSTDNRETAYIEKETNILIEFENLPVFYGSYSYKEGVSKVTNIEFSQKQMWRRYTGEETHIESFIKLNDEVGYGPSISIRFTPGNVKISNKINKAVAVVLQQNETKEKEYFKSVGAFLIAGFMRIPGLEVLERIHLQEITGEHELSESGLVNPETEVSGDKMMLPDIEVIVTQENRVPEDYNLPFENYTVRSKIRVVETGQIIDANLIHKINKENKASFIWDKYVDKVVSFTMNFLYE